MKKRILIVSHADADGHVIAEQTRRNLAAVPSFEVDVVVDPLRTQSHKSWLSLDNIREIEAADIVVFVDLMFSPVDYAKESDALVRFVQARPHIFFLLIDHHPLPERRLSGVKNLRSVYRPDVAECTLGPRSGLMILAALCENQGASVAEVATDHHRLIAQGLRRCAAQGGNMSGEKLMTLIAQKRWGFIAEIAEETVDYHRLVRGRRTKASITSPKLDAAEREASSILKRIINPYKAESAVPLGRFDMPFDFEGERFDRVVDADPTTFRNSPKPTKDVEVISTLLEMAALSLTSTPESTFSKDELLAEMRSLAGEEVEIASRDVDNILEKSSFLKRGGSGRLRLN